ncbi:MAG: ATP-binding cassette domain-containing protein [Gammaproteobacteria bacterium]|nr:ATP-binding cassette domain-containing protein [Gammaproteobacteria bacterium]
MSDDYALEVDSVTAYYGSRRILDDVSLRVGYGEIMVIMGGSGSGKSTLLRHMLALNKLAAGSIRVLGLNIARATGEELHKLRRDIGVAFQSGALLSSLTVGENVALPLREHTDLNDNIVQISAKLKLEVVNLGGFDQLYPAQLSGGMIKRAALARALAMDPKLLFFDEPSAGLDPVVSSELDDLILKLRNSLKMTIVVVTHELESAFKIADRITVLDHGRILISGTVDEVRNSTIARVQDLLQRRSRPSELSADDYLERLTAHVKRA